jgi:adenine deaminase
MSGRSAAETEAELEKLTAVARSLGCGLAAPFMSLSFISLPTVPELGLTDRGLVDVHEHTLISTLL